MFRRVLFCALTALALIAPAVPAQTKGAPPAPKGAGATTVSYAVSYRKPGMVSWTEYRTYRTSKEAVAIARGLHDKGYEVQVLSRFTLTRVPERPKVGSLPAGETVTMAQAQQAFSMMAGQGDISFRFPIDGCYARAHLMIKRLQAKGFRPMKVWTFANGNEMLHIRTPNHPKGFVEWKYHVAPILRVRTTNGQQRWYVIDPSMFQGPVKISAWKNAQKRPNARYEPYVTIARFGQSPTDPSGTRLPGSGYWPGTDPRNVDSHAVAVMRLFKPWEGRVPPSRVFQEFRRIVRCSPNLELNLPLEDRRWLALAA